MSNVVSINAKRTPVLYSGHYCKKLTIAVPVDLERSIQSLTGKNRLSVSIFQDAMTMYYNLIMHEYEGSHIYLSEKKFYDVADTTYLPTTNEFRTYELFFSEDLFEHLTILLRYTKAKGVGDVLRNGLYVYCELMSGSKSNTHSFIVHPGGDSEFIKDSYLLSAR